MAKKKRPSRFAGMHSDERVLYVANHHPIRMARGVMYCLLLAVVSYALGRHAYGLLSPRYHDLVFRLQLSGYFLAAVYLAWVVLEYLCARVFITDRRVMRLQLSPAGYIRKRSLFWNDVAKTKSWHRNIVLRWFKIGTVKITPTIYFNEEIQLPDMYYFEDLANYIDKIVYTYRTTPDKLGQIRPFVTKPKWKRYPLDGTEDLPKRRHLRMVKTRRSAPPPSDNADAAGGTA